jgi:hypothetical protein
MTAWEGDLEQGKEVVGFLKLQGLNIIKGFLAGGL